MHTQFEAKTIGFLHRPIDHLIPLWRKLTNSAAKTRIHLDTLDGHKISATQAILLHGFKVGCNSLFGDSAMHPIPETPRLGIEIIRILEYFRNFRIRCLKSQDSKK